MYMLKLLKWCFMPSEVQKLSFAFVMHAGMITSLPHSKYNDKQYHTVAFILYFIFYTHVACIKLHQNIWTELLIFWCLQYSLFTWFLPMDQYKTNDMSKYLWHSNPFPLSPPLLKRCWSIFLINKKWKLINGVYVLFSNLLHLHNFNAQLFVYRKLLVAITLTSTRWRFSPTRLQTPQCKKKTKNSRNQRDRERLIFSSFDPWPQVVYTREPVSTPWIFHHLPAWARFSPYVLLGTWPSGVRMLHWAKQTELLLHTKLIMGGQQGLHGFVILNQNCPTHMNRYMAHQHTFKEALILNKTK